MKRKILKLNLKTILSVVLLAGLAVWMIFAVRLVWLQAGLVAPAAAFYNNPEYQNSVILENFPVYKQKYANSCGPTTISMVYSYLVEPITEQALADKLGYPLGKSGMLPGQFFELLQSALNKNGFRLEHQVNVPDDLFLERTYRQLKQGVPVPIYFSTVNDWDKPNYDTHYSAIVGIKPQENKVTIANAYGFSEEMAIADLLDAVKFNNYQNVPLNFRLGLLAGVINKNNLFIIQKQ